MDRSFKTETKARVRSGAEPASLQIPLVVINREPKFAKAAFEYVQSLLSLTTTDDLTDSRHQHIHRRHGLLIVIHSHVEGFDLLRIVRENDRPLDVLLRQISFMLALQVRPPVDGKLKRLPERFKISIASV